MPLVPTRPPVVPTTLPEWREMTIVFRLSSGAVHTEDGICYATLAVHPSLSENDPAVTVTHLPTKLAIFKVNEANDAVALVEQLWLKCADAFKRRGEDVDRSKVPPDVLQWIKECNLKRKAV